jgi:hypothetical protein
MDANTVCMVKDVRSHTIQEIKFTQNTPYLSFPEARMNSETESNITTTKSTTSERLNGKKKNLISVNAISVTEGATN